MAEIVNQFQLTVLSVANLVPDRYFDAFTRPVINNKIEEKTCGEGPSLSIMFKDDRHLQNIILQIKVQSIYKPVYVKMFMPNLKMAWLYQLKTIHSCSFFARLTPEKFGNVRLGLS